MQILVLNADTVKKQYKMLKNLAKYRINFRGDIRKKDLLVLMRLRTDCICFSEIFI